MPNTKSEGCCEIDELLYLADWLPAMTSALSLGLTMKRPWKLWPGGAAAGAAAAAV